MSTTVPDYSAVVRFERRHPDLRDEIQVMAEAECLAGVEVKSPRPSFLARLWPRTASTIRRAA
jgi:hypothetical protein